MGCCKSCGQAKSASRLAWDFADVAASARSGHSLFWRHALAADIFARTPMDMRNEDGLADTIEEASKANSHLADLTGQVYSMWGQDTERGPADDAVILHSDEPAVTPSAGGLDSGASVLPPARPGADLPDAFVYADPPPLLPVPVTDRWRQPGLPVGGGGGAGCCCEVYRVYVELRPVAATSPAPDSPQQSELLVYLEFRTKGAGKPYLPCKLEWWERSNVDRSWGDCTMRGDNQPHELAADECWGKYFAPLVRSLAPPCGLASTGHLLDTPQHTPSTASPTAELYGRINVKSGCPDSSGVSMVWAHLTGRGRNEVHLEGSIVSPAPVTTPPELDRVRDHWPNGRDERDSRQPGTRPPVFSRK